MQTFEETRLVIPPRTRINEVTNTVSRVIAKHPANHPVTSSYNRPACNRQQFSPSARTPEHKLRANRPLLLPSNATACNSEELSFPKASSATVRTTAMRLVAHLARNGPHPRLANAGPAGAVAAGQLVDQACMPKSQAKPIRPQQRAKASQRRPSTSALVIFISKESSGVPVTPMMCMSWSMSAAVTPRVKGHNLSTCKKTKSNPPFCLVLPALPSILAFPVS